MRFHIVQQGQSSKRCRRCKGAGIVAGPGRSQVLCPEACEAAESIVTRSLGGALEAAAGPDAQGDEQA